MNNDVDIQEILKDKAKTDEFIQDNKPLILNIIKKICPQVLYTYESEDYIQLGSIALYRAMLKYNKEKNIKFSTLAHVAIERKIQCKLKCEKNKLNQNKINVMSLNTKISSDNDIEFIDLIETPYNMEDNVINNSTYKKLYNSLKPEYQEILKYFANGLNQSDIARELNCTRENIRQKVDKIREKAERLKIV